MPRKPSSPEYDNEELPDSFPGRNAAESIPVIVRLVDDSGEHYRPAEARRWTRTHVMVALRVRVRGRSTERPLWLRAEDVHRDLRLH